MSMGPVRQRAVTRIDVAIQTELHQGENLETGESEVDPFPVQSEGVERLIDGVAEGRLQELYDQLYQDQQVENQAVASSELRVEGQVELRPLPGVTDGRGSHEVWYLGRVEGIEVGHIVGIAQGGDPQPVERPLRPPPDHMLAEARAPTVLGPPPQLGRPVGRFQYVDDELILEPQPGEVEENEESDSSINSNEHSTIGQWTTDSGMPRGHSSGSAGTLNSARSLAVVSFAASVHSGSGSKGVEQHGDGSWELGVLLALVAVVCVLTGVLGTCLWLRFQNRGRISEGEISADGSTPRTPRDDRRRSTTDFNSSTQEGHSQFSPVVNITVHNQISGFPGELKAALDAEAQENSSSSHSKIPFVPPKGLVPDPRRDTAQAEAQENSRSFHSKIPVGPPKGLVRGTESLRQFEDPRPVGPCGLDPVGTLRQRRVAEGSRNSEASAAAQERPCSGDLPKGLDLPVNKGKGYTDLQSGDERHFNVDPGSTENARTREEGRNTSTERAVPLPRLPVQVDKVRRPWGVKRDIILSCRPAVRFPVVFLTQNGNCLHSACDCRPMQCSGLAIQRYLCPHCLNPDALPSRKDPTSRDDRVVWLTKSGQAVHASAECPALARDEDPLTRKLCRCCRWP